MIATRNLGNPVIENLTQPGLLAVFLPMKDSGSKVSGFVASSGRFIPFSYDFTYKDVTNAAVFTEGASHASITHPTIAYFGLK